MLEPILYVLPLHTSKRVRSVPIVVTEARSLVFLRFVVPLQSCPLSGPLNCFPGVFVFSQCVLAVAVALSCLNMRLLTDFLLWRIWYPGILLPRRSESMSFAVLLSITLVQLGVTGHVSDSARSTLFVAVRFSPSLACWRPTHLSPRTARAARWRFLLALP